MQTSVISFRDDPRTQPYRAVRDRDLAGRGGRFILEGEVVLRTALGDRSRFAVESVLLAEGRVAALTPLLETRADLPVYIAPLPVMQEIVGFPIHRGVLAVGRRGCHAAPAPLLSACPADALAIGLVGLANHDNVGGLFRNAAAFGADLVLMDPATCDPLYRKAIRVSVGASLTVPFARAAGPHELVDLLEEAGFTAVGLSPAGAIQLDGAPWPTGRIALLLGPEGEGLPDSILARVRTMRIPMAPGFDSLNVATAAGIALHSAFRARAARTAQPRL
jgi:tRNA G18 (ribose-2'-O)-methylase SpoU